MYLVKLKPIHPGERYLLDKGKIVINKKEWRELKKLPKNFEPVKKWFFVKEVGSGGPKTVETIIESQKPAKAGAAKKPAKKKPAKKAGKKKAG